MFCGLSGLRGASGLSERLPELELTSAEYLPSKGGNWNSVGTRGSRAERKVWSSGIGLRVLSRFGHGCSIQILKPLSSVEASEVVNVPNCLVRAFQ